MSGRPANRGRFGYDAAMLAQNEIEFRVRYQETDAQGVVHHANYLTWFESGRVELLRAAGHSYKALEEAGVFLVVAEVQIAYFLPARFDDFLRLRTTTIKTKGARIQHHYELFRGDERLAEGTSTVACIDRSGRVTRLPEWLRTP
jgi:acyl-CoA thioester hydrolase